MQTQAAPDAPEVLERVKTNLTVADRLAHHVYHSLGRQVPLEELKSFAREGLLEAARRFDVKKGVPFQAYARLIVRLRLLDGARSSSRISRRNLARLRAIEAAHLYTQGAAQDILATSDCTVAPSAIALEQMLAEQLAAMATAIATGLVLPSAREGDGKVAVSNLPDPERGAQEGELRELIRAEIDTLPDDEATLVRRHYLDGERFDRVATELGLSKSWASRLHSRALARLSKRLKDLDG